MCGHFCQGLPEGLVATHSTTSDGTSDNLSGPLFPSGAFSYVAPASVFGSIFLFSPHSPDPASLHPWSLGRSSLCLVALVFMSSTYSTLAAQASCWVSNSFLTTGPLHMLRLSSAWNTLLQILVWLLPSVPWGLSQMFPFLGGLLWPPEASCPLLPFICLLSTYQYQVSLGFICLV